MMRRTSLALAAAGATAALAVSGAALGATAADRPAPGAAPVAVTAGPGTDDNPHADNDPTSAGAAPGGTVDGTVSRQRAGGIALARVGGGRVVEIEAELEHGRPVWSVKVIRDGVRYEVEVDRGDGTVVGTERKRADDNAAGTPAATDDHGGDRNPARTDDRYDDHGGSRADDEGHDDHGGDRSGSDD